MIFGIYGSISCFPKIYDIANVTGSNYLGNVPNIIREACRSICEKHIDVSWAGLWGNQLKAGNTRKFISVGEKIHIIGNENWDKFREKIKNEYPNKLFIFLDEDYYQELFN